MNKILILGQNTKTNELLETLFKKDFCVSSKGTAEEIFDLFSDDTPVLVFADGSLQEEVKRFLDGLKKLNLFPSVPVLVIVNSETVPLIENYFNLGASDVVQLPFNPLVVRRRAENLISQVYCRKNIDAEINRKTKLAVFQNNEKLAVSQVLADNFIEVLANKEFLVGTHAARMRGCVRVLLEKYAELFDSSNLTKEKIEKISEASALHDIGKILVPQELLLKTSTLDSDEFNAVKQHVVYGANLLRGVPLLHQKEFYKLCLDICRHHHERWNGEGYPEGLKGENISLAASATGLIESYVALQELRPYRKAYSASEAYEIIESLSCGTFSEELMHAFSLCRSELEDAFSLV